jgi:archaellum component FlaC
MDRHSLLLRRLRSERNDQTSDEKSEIEDLKEQLKKAEKLIRTLRNEIEKYKSGSLINELDADGIGERPVCQTSRRNETAIAKRKSPRYHRQTADESGDESQEDFDGVQPNLNDLDAAIRRLERTIHRSRKQINL